MKRIVFVLIMCLLALLLSCNSSILDQGSTTSQSIVPSENIYTPEDLNDAEEIEKDKYYEILFNKTSHQYFCLIYDTDNEIVTRLGPYGRQPRVTMVKEQMVKFTIQAGTGISTQWGFYYDIKRDVLSRNFYSIFDEFEGLIVYGGLKKIIIRDIFDKTKTYQEITSFEKPFANVAYPFLDAKFIDDTHIEVTYLSGDNYEVVKEIFQFSSN